MILNCNKLAALCIALLLSGCALENESLSGAISIARLKSTYRGVPLTITADCRIEGLVVSSDRLNNIHNMLVVEDATGGIALLVDQERLFLDYRIGDSIRVECNALMLGSYGGVLRLGGAPSGSAECSALSVAEAARHLSKHGFAPSPPQAARLRIGELSARHICCFVEIADVGFIEQGECWADETLGLERRLVDAASDTLIVRTRLDAEFAATLLPLGRGSIRGVLSYFAGGYELVVNSDDDNDFGAEDE